LKFIFWLGICRKCGETITSLDDPCDILGQIYHGSCAVCVLCGQSVKNKHFFIKDQLYCEEDFLVKIVFVFYIKQK
jgi:LIM domain-containing protein